MAGARLKRCSGATGIPVVSYLSETAANCAGILERRTADGRGRETGEAILKAEMRAAIAASKPVVIPQQQHNPVSLLGRRRTVTLHRASQGRQDDA